MDEKDCRIRQIMISVNRIDGVYYQWARQTGLKENMLSLLYALSDGKSYTQKQICDQWLIPKTTINTVVKECVDKGYIVLWGEPHTKEKAITLTGSGKRYTDSVLQSLKYIENKAYEKTLERYSPEFIAVFEEFANQLQAAFRFQQQQDLD